MMLLHWLVKIRLAGLKDSPVRILSVLLSLVGFALVLGPTLVSGLGAIGAVKDPVLSHKLLTYLFSSIFLFWTVAGGVFSVHLSWQIDWPRAVRLPRGPRRLYAIKIAFGLLGPWLALFFPAWLWLAWRQAAWPLGFALLVPAIMLFAVLANQITGVIALWRDRLTGGLPTTILIFCGFAVVNLMIFATLSAKVMGDTSMLMRFGEAAVWLEKFSLWQWLPGAWLAGAYRAAARHDAGAIAGWLAGLAAAVAGAAWLELAFLRRSYLAGRLVIDSAPRRSWLARLLAAAGGRPGLALLLKEMWGLVRLKSVRIMLFFVASYLPLFVIFIPLTSHYFAEALCIFTLLLFSHVKGNMLGTDCAALKCLFSMPVRLGDVLRVKSLALNLLAGALLAETLLAGLLAKHISLTPRAGAMTLVSCWAFFRCWDMLGLFCSVIFPEPINPQGGQSDSTNPGAFVIVFGLQLLLAPFIIIQAVGERAGWPAVTLGACVALALLADGSQRLLFRPWLEGRLRARREQLYTTLAAPPQ